MRIATGENKIPRRAKPSGTQKARRPKAGLCRDDNVKAQKKASA